MKKILSFLLSLAIMIGMVPYLGVSASTSAKTDVTWNANWIWDNTSTANTWMNLRKTVTLTSVPDSVVARISVDSRYWLWINGRLVVFEGGLKRGSTPDSTYYDEVDIAKYLKTGTNVIAVKAWYWGKNQSFSNNGSGHAGFLFEADIGNQLVISDSSWKVMRDSAYENDPGSSQPNYRLPEANIYYDAQKETAEDWYQDSYDDSSWSNATELGKAPCTPWGQLAARSIPLLKDYGLKEYTNMSSYQNYTTTAQTTLAMQIPYNAQVTPYLKVKAPAGKVITMKTDRYCDGENSVMSTYVTKDGEQEFEALGWFNGQVVYYTIPAGVTVESLQYRETGYDCDLSGSFTSDDSFFNSLWTKAQRTLYVCMRDNYMDCPNRERAQWWADVNVEMETAMYALSPSSLDLYKKGWETTLGWKSSTGVLYTVTPEKNGVFELPMQMLAGVDGLWQYYQYSGDTSLLSDTYDSVKNYLYLWKMGSNGLVIHRGGTWDWPDWGSNADVPVMENAWYYLALTRLKEMAQVLGKTQDITGYDTRLSSIQKMYNTLWTDAGYKSSTQTAPDDRGNAMAVISGLADGSKYATIRNVLTTVKNSSPYMEKFVLQALCQMGDIQDAQVRMKDRYGAMVNADYSTLWELWDSNGVSLNHAWSCGPLIEMSQYMAGISPITPGYSTYLVKPDLGTLNSISTVVPSVKGNISLSVSRNTANKTYSMQLTSPSGTTAKVAVPRFDGENTRVTFNGTVAFEDGKATGAAGGVSYVSDDDRYIYFNVQPGTWNVQAGVKSAGTAGAYTLALGATAGGTVKVNGAAVTTPFTSSYSQGTDVSIEAVPDDGYILSNWSGSIGSTSRSLTVSMTNNTNLTANFQKSQQTQYVLVSVNDPGGSGEQIEYGGTTYTLPATLVVNKGSPTTIRAVDPGTGSCHFTNWSGDIFSADPTLTQTFTKAASLSINTCYSDYTDVAKGASVSADYDMESGSTWSRNNLTDGNPNTKFTTNVIPNVGANGDISANPASITLDMNSPQTFDTITIYPRTDTTTADGGTPNFPRKFNVQVSDNGIDYRTVSTQTAPDNPNGQPQTFNIGTTTARYLRIQVVQLGIIAGDEGIANAYRIQLNEIKAYSRTPRSSYTLSLDKSGSGSVKINGQTVKLPYTGTYPAGTQLAIEGVAGDQNYLTGWSGSLSSSSRVVYVQMNSNVSLKANFNAVSLSTQTNLALGKPVSTNSSYTSGSVWRPNNLTDGVKTSTSSSEGYSSASFSSSDITTGQPYIEIDLGQDTAFNQIVLYPRTDISTTAGGGESANYPASFKIQVKADGSSTYTDAYTVENGANPMGSAQTYNIGAQKARYVRLYVTKLGSPASDESKNYRLQMAEFEVYNATSAVFSMGNISLSTNGASADVVDTQSLPITADVTSSSFADNSLVWSLEDETGAVSGIADLLNTDTNRPTLVAKKPGVVYVVARFANGLPASDRIKLTIADQAAISGQPANPVEVTSGNTQCNLMASSTHQPGENLTYSWRVLDASTADYTMTANGASCAFAPTQAGAYTVQVHVTGDQGTDATTQIVINATDRSALKTTLEYAKQQQASASFSDVIPSVQASFTSALNGAQKVYDDASSTQAAINAAWQSLLKEIQKLGFTKGNKGQLNFAIATAKDIYNNLGDYVTNDAKTAFIRAYTGALAVQSDENALQDEVDKATGDLINAMLALRFKADKSVLGKILAQANGVDTALYTSDSVTALKTAIQAATAVYNKEDATGAEVSAAVDTLQDAINGLKLLSTGGGSSVNSPGNAHTGGHTPFAEMALLLASSGAVLFFARKKKIR